MANEADLKLIQIGEFEQTSEVAGSGEEFIVVRKADGKTYKMSTADFKAFLGTVQVQVPRAISPTDPAPTLSGVYRPTVSGTYANLGGLVIDTNGKLNEVIYDGTTFVNVVTDLPEPDLSGLATKETVSILESRLDNTPILSPSSAELSGTNIADYVVAGTLIPVEGITMNRVKTFAMGSTGHLNISVSIFDVPGISPTINLATETSVFSQDYLNKSAANPLEYIEFPEITFSGYPLIVIKNQDDGFSIAIRRKTQAALPSDGIYAHGYYNNDNSDTLTKIVDTSRFLAPIVWWENSFIKKEDGKSLSTNDYSNTDKAIVNNVPNELSIINTKLEGKDVVTFDPSSVEMAGSGNRSGYLGIGLLIRDTSVQFDAIYHSIMGQDENAFLKLDIYKWSEIKTGTDIDLGTPIYSQEFQGLTTLQPWQTLKLSETIRANGQYILLVFTNLNTARAVSSFRFSNAPVPSDGIWSVPYFIDNTTLNWAKNSDVYRFASPRLILTSNLLTKESIVLPSQDEEIQNDLKNEFHKKNITVLSGVYGGENTKYQINVNQESYAGGYLGVEFKINENIHTVSGQKEIVSIDRDNGDYIKLFIKTEPLSPFRTKQILIQNASDATPEWNFQSEYPLPYYNSYFFTRTRVNGVVTEVAWPKRNPREWKPLVGSDAFFLQFKPSIIRNGGKIYDNQSVYQGNENWYLNVLSDRVQITNDDLSKNVEFLYSTYPFVDTLFKAIKDKTRAGGELEDFVFEQMNTGIISNSTTSTRPSTDLLICSLKIVDKYPYRGPGASASKVMYDSWKAVVPYWKDESLHSFEIATNEGADAVVTIDGKVDEVNGIIINAKSILNKCKVKLGVSGGLNSTFYNYESYIGSTNGYEMDSAHGINNFIASKKNPRIVGVMWHDAIPSDVVGRDTTWADVPKYMRVAFDQIVNATYVGGAPIYYRDYGQFTSEPVLVSGSNIYEVNTVDDLRIRGVGTVAGGVVTQIRATEIVSGTWTERTFVKRYMGVIIRVGASVNQSTAFLDQCFEMAERKGYKTMTWADALRVLDGEITDTYKVFAPQFDDYPIYMFTIPEIRQVFDRRNIPISVAWDLTASVTPDGVIDPIAVTTTNRMRTYGHETVIHNHWKYIMQFVSDVLSDDAERGIKESMEMAQLFGTEMNIWDQSQNLSTANSQKLMEVLGMKMSISTQKVSTTRATNKMYASRATLNPSTLPVNIPLI